MNMDITVAMAFSFVESHKLCRRSKVNSLHAQSFFKRFRKFMGRNKCSQRILRK